MTGAELIALVTPYADREVVVAGHGALHLVTHGGSEDHGKVCVLYVVAPEPEPLPAGQLELPEA